MTSTGQSRGSGEAAGRPVVTADRSEELRTAAAAFGAPLSPAEAGKLLRLAEMVREANERVRLTAITGWAEMLVKHLVDSLAPVAFGRAPLAGERVLDLGSGGGFPGLVLAVVRPDASFTLLEATRKKADFLRDAGEALSLAHVDVWSRRSEEAAAADGREVFDLVTARAVAELRVLVELSLPLLKVGGTLLAWKGPEAAAEIEEAHRALALIGGAAEDSIAYDLPHAMGRRVLVPIRKCRPTPAGYPRRPGMAEKRPL